MIKNIPRKFIPIIIKNPIINRVDPTRILTRAIVGHLDKKKLCEKVLTFTEVSILY